ncbi:MAG: hypothetical protein IJ784_10880 [Ruminiclostridium sp.]|nr:hypothetical protein [Ruminiclostridium sp.]
MKKRYAVIFIILCSVLLCLFPADLFFFEISEWVIYAVITAMTIAAAGIVFLSGARMRGKISASVTALILIVTAAGGIWLDPYFNGTNLRLTGTAPTQPYDTQIPADKACADLDYAMKYLQKVHPSFMNGTPENIAEAFRNAKNEVNAQGSVTVNELARKTESILSLLNDAHTAAFCQYAEPLYLKHYNSWKQGGWSLTALSGITLKELLKQKSDLYSFEAESWELESLKKDLLNIQGLDYLGFSGDDGITFTFTDDEGNESSGTYYTDDFVTYAEYLQFNGIESANDSSGSFVSFTVDEDRSLAVLTLNECVYNSEYVNCVREMFTQVKEKGIKNVAVDLRENGGGNDQTAIEFIRYLDTDGYLIATEHQRLGFLTTEESRHDAVNDRIPGLTFTGNVYVLSSAGTFSSAMLFTQYIKDNNLGTVIGEPPGNDPNGFGETVWFRMPASGIILSISSKQFTRADRECTDRYVMPDVPCEAGEAMTVLYSMISES